MASEYIPIMIQSLEKKIRVLDRIAWLNNKQMDSLQGSTEDPDLFDECVEDKSKCIEQLELLDSGFESLFEHVREEINFDRAAYAKEIKTMQQLIKQITDRSMSIQAQEARNKELMVKKFAQVKKQARNVRANSKATAQYYQNMMQMGVVDPQFVNRKK